MSRVMTFSRVFPKYHPSEGIDTFFVEKILNGILPKGNRGHIDIGALPEEVKNIVNEFQLLLEPNDIKGHTIRAGNRWRVGDKFSPRVWSGKPYASKQIIIAPDIEIKKVWTVEKINTVLFINDDGVKKILLNPLNDACKELAKNDGLTAIELCQWFKKDFTGQIICWNENIEY